MILGTRGAILSLAATLAVVGIARADERDRALIDRVEVKASPIYGMARVRALVSATELKGARIPHDFKPALTVKIGGDKVAFVTGLSKNAEVEVEIVLVIATTDAFKETFEPIREILKTGLLDPLEKLGPRFRIAVIGYDSTTVGQKRLGTVAEARKALDGLVPEDLTSEVALATAVSNAVSIAAAAANRPKLVGAMTRPVVIVVSDGDGILPESRPDITAIGEAAAKGGVRVHGLGFSPGKHRRSLLTLGELAKTSGGTFRWVQEIEGWDVALDQLVDQLAHEYVVTALAPLAEVAGKRLAVSIESASGPLTAAPVSLKAPKCGKVECAGDAYCVRDVCIARRRSSGGGGVLRWILLVLGAAVVIGGSAMFVRSRRGPRRYPIKPAPLPSAVVTGYSVPVAAPAPAARPGGPVLIIMSGPETGRQVPLHHGFTLGKAPGSHLSLIQDGTASTNHAQITVDGATWTLTDLGSTNGTFANGSRVTSVALFHGMSLRVGSTDLRFWQA